MTNFHGALRAPYQPSSLAFVLMGVTAGLLAAVRAVKNRRNATLLAEMDDRMLKDIGLTRSDLRDAYAEPLWRDPTAILVKRAGERRASRQRTAAIKALRSIDSPSLAPEPGFSRPATSRPARYTI